jgi:hypothetical protein
MSFEIDKNHNLPIYSPTCFLCRNFNRDDSRIPGSCKAFKEIPIPIWDGRNSHIKSYKNDNNIQFESIED